jgi:hypothetical protein
LDDIFHRDIAAERNMRRLGKSGRGEGPESEVCEAIRRETFQSLQRSGEKKEEGKKGRRVIERRAIERRVQT